jgi:tRNA(fMet)-specific endonuclease VapC
MAWLLDTNVVIALFREPAGVIGTQLRTVDRDAVFLSTIVLHELFFGAFDSAQIERNLARIARLRFAVLDITAADAESAGAIRARLKSKGRPIGPYDVLIAGQALARDLTLVTNNTREFSRVEGLRLEDWSLPPPA